MKSQFVDLNVPSLREGNHGCPEDLPHGLLPVPPSVREQVENEQAKYPPETFEQAQEGLLNLWTILYHFDSLGHEVIYRQSSQGPDVLAVGTEETLALKKTMPLEEQLNLKVYLGY
jgi:hypothetical protein